MVLRQILFESLSPRLVAIRRGAHRKFDRGSDIAVAHRKRCMDGVGGTAGRERTSLAPAVAVRGDELDPVGVHVGAPADGCPSLCEPGTNVQCNRRTLPAVCRYELHVNRPEIRTQADTYAGSVSDVESRRRSFCNAPRRFRSDRRAGRWAVSVFCLRPGFPAVYNLE